MKKLQELNCKNEIEKLKRDIMNMKKSHRRALNLYAKEMYVHRRGDFESGRSDLDVMRIEKVVIESRVESCVGIEFKRS